MRHGDMLRAHFVAALLAVTVFLTASALAHSWYPAECCSGIDCDILLDERVRAAPGGYLIDGEHFVAQANVRKSPDDHYHGCFPNKKLGCFWAPPQGS